MNIRQVSKSTGRLMLLAALLAVSAIGCNHRGSVGFQTNISKGAIALRAGKLDTADLHIKAAANAAQSHEEKRQAQSLGRLSSGARVMMEGNVSQARQHWAAISDPRLNLQVRRQAERIMDIQIPAAPTKAIERQVR